MTRLMKLMFILKTLILGESLILSFRRRLMFEQRKYIWFFIMVFSFFRWIVAEMNVIDWTLSLTKKMIISEGYSTEN